MRKLFTLLFVVAILATGAQAQQNLALDSQTTVSASSSAPGFPASAVIDGDRAGYGWGNGGGWNDAASSRGVFPDTLTVTLGRQYSIGRVTVVTLQDAFGSPVEPTPTQTCGLYGVKDFTIDVLTSSGWVQVASVTNNSLCVRDVSFSPVRGTAARINVTASNDGLYSRVVEFEVYSR